jgi:hypothetical protein
MLIGKLISFSKPFERTMMFEDNNYGLDPLDLELAETMDSAYALLRDMADCPDNDEQLKLRIAGHNLRALSQVLLMADSHPDFGVNLKQVVLALLGTSDWMLRDLPELPE